MKLKILADSGVVSLEELQTPVVAQACC